MLRRFSRPRSDAGLAKTTVVLGLLGALVAGGTGAALLTSGSRAPLEALGGASPAPVAEPKLIAAGQQGSTVPWKRSLTLGVTDGTFDSLVVLGPDGSQLEGRQAPDHWVGHGSLVPATSYSVHAVLKDAAGDKHAVDTVFKAAPAEKVLHATVNDPGKVVGVGQPVIVRFDQAVKGAAARTAVQERLKVTTSPAVAGAWRWYNSFEVHYRAEKYWTKGTTVSVDVDLSGLRVPGTDVWGGPTATAGAFEVGSAMVSVADLKTHKLTVTQDGKVLRVLPMSGGSDKYPTKGGVHIVLLKEAVHTFNSATVGIPTNSPDGYYKKLPWSVRISNGGAFVHSQPGSIRSQGFRNVSHGCINLSPSNAEWFFGLAKKGDVVDVVNAVVKPVKWDAGMADWNYSWAEWQKGNLDG